MGYISLIVCSMYTTGMPYLKIMNLWFAWLRLGLPLSGHLGSDVSPEMQHCVDAIVCEVSASQLDSWCSFCHHRKCSSHHQRCWIFKCVLEKGFLQPHSQKQKWEESHFLWIGSFWSWGRALLIPCCYSWWNLGPSCWTETKGNPSDCTILSLPGRKNQKILL